MSKTSKLPAILSLIVASVFIIVACATQKTQPTESKVESATIEQDLNTFCSVVKEIKLKHPKDPDMRAGLIATQLNEKITNPNVRRLIEALAGVDPKEKYPLILRFAKEEAQLTTWSCPELK